VSTRTDCIIVTREENAIEWLIVILKAKRLKPSRMILLTTQQLSSFIPSLLTLNVCVVERRRARKVGTHKKYNFYESLGQIPRQNTLGQHIKLKHIDVGAYVKLPVFSTM